MKKVLIIVCIIMLLTPTIALAYIPPGPGPATCSPGFWKNHTEIWPAPYTVDTPYVNPDDPYIPSGKTFIYALQGGYDTKVSRFVVAGILNAAFPAAPCLDD